MTRILILLPLALIALSGCSSGDDYPASGPASSYTPGTEGAPARSNAPAAPSGLGNSGGGAGNGGIQTNPSDSGS